MTRLQLSRVHALAGANLWHSDQVLEAELRVDTPEMSAEALGKALSEQFVFAGYARALPAGSGYPTVADGVARAALALERVAGARVSYCGSRGPALAVEFEDEAMARPCLEAAARLCESVMRGETVDFAAL
ncbi:MAG: hypothetical protein HZB13_12435, partial [Acidobacteria bacterium]|nr:hypothetical protein [Acidobacteriota bacterium]